MYAADTAPMPKIDHIWIELTHRCNLQCRHCYTSSGPDVVDASPLSLNEYARIIEDARTAGASSIQFIGGEPVLSPYLPDLLQFSKEAGFESIEVYSNLVSLPKKVLEAIVTTGASVATSLYGDNAGCHDKITTQNGSFEKTVKNIKALLSSGNFVRVGVIAQSEDQTDAIAAVEYAKTLGVHHVSSDRARPFGRLEPDFPSEIAAIKGVCGKCWSGKVCIDPNGKVFPCIMSRTWAIGSIKDSSLLALIRSGNLTAVQNRMQSLFSEHVGEVSGSCDPEDKCPPGACKPQVGGPDDCKPKQLCAPDNYKWQFSEHKSEWRGKGQSVI